MKWLFTCLIVTILVSGCSTKRIRSYEVDLTPYRWPEATVQKKISLAQIIDQDLLMNKMSFFQKFIGMSYDLTPLYRPFAVAANDTYIAASDTLFGVVYLIEKETMHMEILTTFHKQRLKSPVDIAFHNGQLFIIDSALAQCFAYSLDQKQTQLFDIQLDKPTSISIDPESGDMFITDTGRNTLILTDQDGNIKREITQDFNYPIDSVIDPVHQEVYVLDAMQFKVKVLDYDGKLKRQFGKIGNKPGSFSKPKSIALDHHRRVYVVDSEFDNFQIFDANGRLLYFIGASGQQPANFYLPARIDYHKNKLYVADTYNSRIQVFKILD